MSDDKQQPAPPEVDTQAKDTQQPPKPEERKLAVDDVESDEGDDVKGGGIRVDMGTPCL